MQPETAASMDEWLKALTEAQQSVGADGVTMEELAGSMSCSTDRARRRLKELICSGRAKLAGTRWATRIDGKQYPCPVYSLVKQKR